MESPRAGGVNPSKLSLGASGQRGAPSLPAEVPNESLGWLAIACTDSRGELLETSLRRVPGAATAGGYGVPGAVLAEARRVAAAAAARAGGRARLTHVVIARVGAAPAAEAAAWPGLLARVGSGGSEPGGGSGPGSNAISETCCTVVSVATGENGRYDPGEYRAPVWGGAAYFGCVHVAEMHFYLFSALGVLPAERLDRT